MTATALSDFTQRLDKTAEDTENLLSSLLSDVVLADEIARPKRGPLVREQDLEPLAGDRRCGARLEKSQQVHAALRPNRRVKKVFFWSGIAVGTASPARRRAASR